MNTRQFCTAKPSASRLFKIGRMSKYINKEVLLASCHEVIDQKLFLAKQTMEMAQESANEENKSSVGDKYETGRAMAQQERDKAAVQLTELNKLKRILHTIDAKEENLKVEPGALVTTNQGLFYIATSVGQIDIDNEKVFVISPISPLVQAMLGRAKGDEVELNSRKFIIQNIY